MKSHLKYFKYGFKTIRYLFWISFFTLIVLFMSFGVSDNQSFSKNDLFSSEFMLLDSKLNSQFRFPRVGNANLPTSKAHLYEYVELIPEDDTFSCDTILYRVTDGKLVLLCYQQLIQNQSLSHGWTNLLKKLNPLYENGSVEIAQVDDKPVSLIQVAILEKQSYNGGILIAKVNQRSFKFKVENFKTKMLQALFND